MPTHSHIHQLSHSPHTFINSPTQSLSYLSSTQWTNQPINQSSNPLLNTFTQYLTSSINNSLIHSLPHHQLILHSLMYNRYRTILCFVFPFCFVLFVCLFFIFFISFLSPHQVQKNKQHQQFTYLSSIKGKNDSLYIVLICSWDIVYYYKVIIVMNV